MPRAVRTAVPSAARARLPPQGAASDSPDTARALIYKLSHRYLTAAGGTLTPAADGAEEVEISPLASFEGEGLEELAKGKTFASPALVDNV